MLMNHSQTFLFWETLFSHIVYLNVRQTLLPFSSSFPHHLVVKYSSFNLIAFSNSFLGVLSVFFIKQLNRIINFPSSKQQNILILFKFVIILISNKASVP